MDADTTRELLADGERLTGLDLLELLIDEDELSEVELAEAYTQVGVLAGCLWNAAIVLVEQAFEDLDDYDDDIPAPDQLEESMLLGTLPPQHASDYTRGFARQFLVAAVDLTARLSQGWRAPACFAQELQLQQLLGLTEVMIEVNAANVPFDWRVAVEEVLSDRPLPVAADAPPVSAWFIPFDDGDDGDDGDDDGANRLPPYAEDDAA